MLRFLTCALFASLAPAQEYFSVALDGAQEVPPLAVPGQGWGVVRLDPASGVVRVFVRHEGLSGAPVAAHLHQAPAGANGPIVVGLSAASPSTFTGAGTLTPAQVATLQSGGTYVNVHTAANPSGEIRGQVVRSATTRFTGVLSGAQEVPPNPSAATGTVIAFLHEPENRVVYAVDTSGLVGVLAAHFHRAPSGSNGPIVVTLNGAGGDYCGVSDRLATADVSALQSGQFYVNVHTSAVPTGEIRAQLVPDAGDHFVARIDGAQEVPPSGSPGLGSASLIRAPDGTVTLAGQFAGLTAPATAAHVHLGAPGVNGGIVFPLVIAGSTLSGSFSPSPAQLADMRAGNWYVNVHTSANPAGEIRGQLDPARLPRNFGRGCAGSGGIVPEIGASGLPVVGTSMAIDLYGSIPGTFAVFVFGDDRDTFGPLFLPLELTTVGINAPGCYLLLQPTAIVAEPVDGFGCSSFALNIPFDPTLRGRAYHSQWFVLDFAANPSGFVASSALSLTVN